MKFLKPLSLCALLSAAVFGFQNSSKAQCPLTFSPNPGPATVTIEAYWWINDSYTSSNNIAVFQDVVTVSNSTVPAGTYPGWCIDARDTINGQSETYNVLMFSSCDPNLDKELANLGYSYGFSYPSTDTNDSAAQWNQLNYILNHPVAGASYWDIQGAIWNIIGGPLPPNSYFEDTLGLTGLSYDTNNVSEMVNNARANAASWQPQCGDVIAVILAITSPDNLGDFPVQLTILQVPVPCPCPTQTICCSVPSQNCYGGSLWCNAHLNCNPGKECTVYCENACVTLTCNNGKTCTYPVPNCQVDFSPTCRTPSCQYQGGKWTTTVPCCGDSQIFLSGCGDVLLQHPGSHLPVAMWRVLLQRQLVQLWHD